MKTGLFRVTSMWTNKHGERIANSVDVSVPVKKDGDNTAAVLDAALPKLGKSGNVTKVPLNEGVSLGITIERVPARRTYSVMNGGKKHAITADNAADARSQVKGATHAEVA